jgi:GPH family glycoside/pentoside/hexuronide:cation symporter
MLGPLSSWFLFTPDYPYLQLLFVMPLTVAKAAVSMFPGAMMADLIDLDELRTRRRREGSFASVWSFLLKCAMPVAAFAFGWLLEDFAGFSTGKAVSESTILRLRLILLVAPLIPLSLAALCAYLYPVNEEKAREVRRLLEERRARETAAHDDSDR